MRLAFHFQQQVVGQVVGQHPRPGVANRERSAAGPRQLCGHLRDGASASLAEPQGFIAAISRSHPQRPGLPEQRRVARKRPSNRPAAPAPPLTGHGSAHRLHLRAPPRPGACAQSSARAAGKCSPGVCLPLRAEQQRTSRQVTKQKGSAQLRSSLSAGAAHYKYSDSSRYRYIVHLHMT